MRDNYGEYTKMLDVPIGTKFHVVNGDWDGEIIEEDGRKKILVYYTGETHEIGEDRALVIEILVDNDKEEKQDHSCDIPY